MSNQSSTLMAHCGARKVTRDELKEMPLPEATKTHQPLAHFEIVEVLEEALSFRHLRVVKDEYAVSQDGLKMFGVMDLDAAFEGGRFSIGLRNSNDKSMRLALTAGYRVFVCDNMAFSGDFSPLLHKHTSKLNLTDSIAVAVDRIYRGLDSIANQIKLMREYGLTDNYARLIIYRAFVERVLKGVPRQLMPAVHSNYFDPDHEDFRSRNLWSLSNAFTSAFKSLGPLKQFEATAKLGLYMSGIKGDAASAERRPLFDCGTGRFRLVKADDGEVKEEEIQNAAEWGDTGDQIDSMVQEEAARAAA
ncbi:MAG: hypothetical protein IPL32_03805 [Chloracidobacterium sp.]|nr:hypothetical protein [Chloracidobacterium sp.]